MRRMTQSACAHAQLERETALHRQGNDDLDARTREYEDAKNGLAGHKRTHEHHAGCAAWPTSQQTPAAHA